MNLEDIQELMQDSKDILDQIKNQKKINKAKTKSLMEHLRSCLEYSAHDIANSISVSKDKIYFPYSNTSIGLEKSAQKNFPDLKIKRPDVYNEIVSLHLFNEDGSWLTNMCDLTNDVKHKGAINLGQETNHVVVKINGNNFIHSKDSTIIFKGGIMDGRRIDDFVIENDNVTITKPGEVSIDFKITKDRKIVVNNSELDLISFLSSCIERIEVFIQKLYQIL